MILRGTVFSNILGKDTGITIVTPGNLQEGGPYKVAYLLHGLCGDSATWVDDSMLPVYAREGRTIFILPDAARSFYSDMRHGPRYFTYLVEELPQLCKAVFQISARRRIRPFWAHPWWIWRAQVRVVPARAIRDVRGVFFRLPFLKMALQSSKNLEASRRLLSSMGSSYTWTSSQSLAKNWSGSRNTSYWSWQSGFKIRRASQQSI